MPPGRILLLTAVHAESRAIARELPAINLHTIGIRAIRLPTTISPADYACILLAGFAGGLNPTLKTGDIVVDDPANLVREPNVPRGRIHSADHVVSSPEEKRRLFAATGADAVDMENDLVRQFAQNAGLPFLAVRAILDTAGQSLPPELSRITDPFGRPRILPMLWALCSRPALIADLIRLARASKLAGARLGQALRRIIPALQSRNCQKS